MTAPSSLAARSASIGRRAAAYAIDVVIAYGIGVACAGITVGIALGVGAATDPSRLALTFLLASGSAWAGMLGWAIVYTAMQGGRGSVGQRALDLRLLDADGPVAVGFWRALWRNVVWALSCAIVVGWFTPLFDAGPRRQGWHDKAARAVVVDMRGTDASSPATSRISVASPRAVPAESAHGGSPSLEPHPWFLEQPAPAPRAPVQATPVAAPAPAFAPQAPAPAPLTPVYAPPLAAPAPAFAPSVPAPAYAAPAFAGSARTPVGSVALSEAPVPSERGRAEASAPATVVIPQVPATRPIATAADVGETRTAVTVPPPAQRAALFDDAPVIAVLTWDDGTRMAVYGRTLYGRNPAVEPGIVSVPVRDETLSLSKTHFEIGGDASGAWIADRHSTNGTVLVRDGGRHPLVAGSPIALRAGDRLELGDRTVIVGTAS